MRSRAIVRAADSGAAFAGDAAAPVISYVLLPFEFAFWIGFALPFGPPLGIAPTVLLVFSDR